MAVGASESMEVLSGVFEVSGEGLCLLRADGEVLRANDRWLGARGLSRAQASGTRLDALVPATACLEALRACAASGRRTDVPIHQLQRGWWTGAIAPLSHDGGPLFLLSEHEVAPPVVAVSALDSARARDLLQRSDDIELVLRPDGFILEANDKAVEAYGYAHHELLGMNINALRVDALQVIGAQLAEALEKGICFEATHRRKDGSTFPVEVRSSVITVANTPFLHSIVRDLTAERRAQAEHRVLGELVRSANDGLVVTDDAARIVEYGGAAEQILGWHRDQVLGRSFEALLLDEFPEGDEVRVRKLMVARQPVRTLSRAATSENGRVALDVTATPLWSSARKFVGWIVVFRDMSPRIEDEQAARRRESKLRATLRERDVLLEHSPMAVMKVRDWVLTWCNSKTTELFGWPLDELRGRLTMKLFADETAWRAFAARAGAELRSTGACTAEFAFVHRDGRELWCRAHGRVGAGADEVIWFLEDVTSRRRAEEEQRERRALLDAYFRSSLVGICYSVPGKGLLDANPRFCQMLGYSLDELRGKHWRFFTHPDSVASDAAELERIAAGKADGCVLEKRYLRKDGSSFWGLVSLSVAQGPRPGESRVVALVKDIDRRKNAEEAQARSEARLQRVLESTQDAFFDVDLQTLVAFRSKHFAALFGLEPGQLAPGLGAVLERIHPDDVKAYEAQSKEVLEGRRLSVHAEVRIRHADGSWRWLRVRGAVRGEPGARYYSGTVRDVTERRRVSDALQQSEARLRSTFASMAEGVVVQDINGRIISCNAAAERILGLTQAQMEGRTSLDPRWRAIREDGSAFPGEEHPAMVALRKGRAVSGVLMGVETAA